MVNKLHKVFPIHRFTVLGLTILLSSCGGSSGGSSDGSVVTAGGPTTVPSAPAPTTPPPGETPVDPPIDVTGNPEPPENGANPNPEFLTADSGLSHTGQLLPKGPAATASDPLVSEIGRSQVTNLPQSLAVVYEVVENHGSDLPVSCKSLAAEFASCSVANIHIKSTDGSLENGNWRIFFPSIRRVLRVDSDEFDVFLVNGDLNYIQPASGFTGFNAEPVKTLKIITEFSQLHESDFMPRYFLVRDGGQPEVIANTNDTSSIANFAVPITGENRRAFNGEPHALADADNRFEKFSEVATQNVSSVIVPTPESTVPNGGVVDISGGLNFTSSDLAAASVAALNARGSLLVGGNANNVAMSIDASLPDGTYVLTVAAGGISVSGADDQSLFYGGQSLLALITPGSGTVPAVTVTDSPRFDYRGMHVDVARNFHPADRIRKLIDQMAAYKMNVLHLHLTDDEGWRLEIPGLPELTSVGARRQFAVDGEGNVTESAGLLPQLGSGPFANTEGSGFFSRSEFVDLLRYARDRFVEVVPEIDMPAHARAAVVAMRARAANLGQPGNTNIRLDDPLDTSRYLTVQHYDDGIINPCVPGTYNFIQNVVTEVRSMYDDAGVPLDIWHMGGDEARNVLLGGGFEDLSAGSVTPFRGDIDQSQFHFPYEQSPACQALIASDPTLNNLNDLNTLFVVRTSEIVRDAGIPAMYAYQDILRNIDANQIATSRAGVGFWEVVWQGGFNTAYEYPLRGFETLVAVPDYLYFDFPQEIDPQERGYYWATRFTDTQKVFSFAPENLPQNAETTLTRDGFPFTATGNLSNGGFTGMQGQLWGETVRTGEHFEYMMYPRLLALAERAWHRGDWELDYAPGVTFSDTSNRVNRGALAADWQRFANALGQKELPKLDAAGVLYRIPSAGARTVNGALQINTQYPGLQVQFSADGNSWQDYNPANPPASAAFVRALSANNARTGRATPAN